MPSTRMDAFIHEGYPKNTPDKLTYLLTISGVILFLMIVIMVIA